MSHKASLSSIPTPEEIAKAGTEPFYFPLMLEVEKPITKEVAKKVTKEVTKEVIKGSITTQELSGATTLRSTFSGLPKQLFHKENEQRKGYYKAWNVEAYTHCKGLDMAIPELHLREGDLFTDLEEIPRCSALHPTGHETPYPSSEVDYSSWTSLHGSPFADGLFWDLFQLSCRFYYYLFEFYSGFWNGPVLIRHHEQESHETRTANRFSGTEYDE
ncbi:hypothetical protein BGZ93_001130 [Podila epicladia]|nr:hypothetical protein BGZ92_004568 [Podila epicladia]KAG0098096.1 hypothetical protein BGZ93_001130 [Podila epicladia]